MSSAKILLKVNQDGSQVRLRVTWRRLSWAVRTTTSLRSSTVNRLPVWVSNWRRGANALDTATAIRAELKKMEPFFPSGLKIVYPYDTTPFVKISIHEVVKTLVEAIILVFLVMYCSCKTSAQR